MARNLHSKKNNKDFRQIYKLPLYLDEYSGHKVWTADDGMAFDFVANIPEQDRRKIVAILNGETTARIDNNIVYKEGVMFFDGQECFVLRGWGHLTGGGALNLSAEDAKKIQDDFGEFILKTLTKSGE